LSVIDIGAGIGEFSVLMARHHRAEVHAYEPDRDSADLAAANIELNGCVGVELHREAVGSKEASYVPVDAGPAVLQRFQPADDGPGEVAGVTLATAVSRLPAGRCDLLKMDCEGAEFDILMNAREVLGRVDRIVAEVHDDPARGLGRDHLSTFLEQAGYVVWIEPNPVHDSTCLMYAERSVGPLD
jgi:FkbM family methyltransferase